MKKHLFAIVLVLALLVTVGALAVQADTQAPATCPHCDRAMDSILWLPWSFTDGDISGGHYYLAREYYGQTGQINIPEGADVCLDLRDQMYFTQDLHPFDIYGTLTVMDTGDNGQFITTGKNGYSGGFAKVKSTGTLNILSGTIRRLDRADISIYAGGLIYVEGGKMTMSGGALVGGVVETNDTYNAQGGNIFLKGGSLELTGGTVSGGMALSNTSKKAQGGNIYISADATVVIDGGVVADGYSDQDGGNVFLSGLSLTLRSGSITGGHAVRHGGNIAQTNEEVENSTSLLGGSVTGGVAGGVLKNYADSTVARGSGGGGNFYSYSANGSLTISNSTVSGDIKFDKIKTVTLSGAAKIGLGKSNGLYLHEGIKIDASGLTDGAEIFVNATGAFTQALPEADAQRIAGYFKGAIRTAVSLESDFTLKGTQGSTGYCPHCYDPANPQTVTWYKGAAPTAGELHRYLETSNVSSSSNIVINQDTVWDLNGYTIYRDGRRIIMNAADKTLTVMDSFGGGKLEGTGINETYNKTQGGLIQQVSKSHVVIYSGTLKQTPGAGTSVVQNGGLINATSSGATVTMHGGMIRDGIVTVGGGNVHMTAGTTFTMDGGIVKGGSAANKVGGNLYLLGTAQIKGGFVIGGAAGDGGNLYTTGSTTISGGIIYGGKATDDAATETEEGVGGNIYSAGATTISGGVVTAGNARIGGNIYVSNDKTLTVSGTGIIAAGVASTNGGNVYVYNGTVDVTGGTVTAGMAVSGGNFYISADGKTVTVSGGLVTAGIATDADATGKGGNFYIGKGTLTVSGGTVSRGIATYGGGNVYINGATMNLTGGKVLGGRPSTSSKDGGNVYVAANGQLTVSGGELSGGYAGDCGGNVYMSNTTSRLVISGGTITNGYAYKYGGNIHLNNGSLSMTGGTVSYGQGGRGGNLCLSFYADSTATIDGVNNPKIIGGEAVVGEGGNILFLDNAHQPASAYSPHKTAPWLAIGKCTVEGGKAANFGDNIYVNKNAYFRVLSSFDSTTTVYMHPDQLPAGKLYGGMLNTVCNTAAGEYTGKLILENDPSAPFILHKDGGLQIAATAQIKNGQYTWYIDNAALMAAYDATSDYIMVAGGQLELAGGSYTVDLAGNTVDITGTGTVYGMDSGNDTYETCGSATFGTGVTLGSKKTEVNGKVYFALNEGNTYNFHRLGMDITGVNLRPSEAGIYYTAKWQCDPILAEKVEAHGVVVSLAGAPGDDFQSQSNNLYTKQTGLENGAVANGVLIKDIVKTVRPDKNSDYAQMPIHAVAYVTVDGQNYTGVAESYSLHSLLEFLDEEIYEYYTHADALQSFLSSWEAYGLSGSQWSFAFDVPEAIVKLQQLYAGTMAYQGELHDHAATGGTSDGHNTLTEWLTGMQQLDMDFATIVDHKQYLHMQLPEWDNKYFIGGTEIAVGVSDLVAATQNKAHINLIFYDPMDLKAAIEAYDAYDSKGGFKAQVYAEDYAGTDAAKLAGGWHFEYLFGATAPTKADVAKLAQITKAHNGVFVQVHPKSASYIKSTDPLDYWFEDYTGLEVFYTYYSTRNSTATKNNYKLWTDLLRLGKKVWATAGNDEHAAPSNKALSTIYSTEQDAKDFVERLSVGNFTAGPVGVQMVVGDQVMGYETDFTGKQLAFRIGDFHSTVYDPTHNYQAVLIADEKVLERWDISCEETFYYSCEADASVGYYRVEIYDVTTGEMLALGNPIWNTAAE